MTSHEAALFKELERLRLKQKSDIKTENEKFCKRLNNKGIIEKTLQDRHIKRRQEKELDNEFEILKKKLEAKANLKSQPLARSFLKDGLSQDFSVIPPMETSEILNNYSLNLNTLLAKTFIQSSESNVNPFHITSPSPSLPIDCSSITLNSDSSSLHDFYHFSDIDTAYPPPVVALNKQSILWSLELASKFLHVFFFL